MNASTLFRNIGFRRLALASAVALSAFGASQAFAASETSTADATVVKPITIVLSTAQPSIQFGSFAAGATAGTVVLTTGSSASATGGVTRYTSGTAPSAVKFDLTGNSDMSYTISVPASVNLSDSATTPNTMKLTTAWDTLGDGSGTNPGTGKIDGFGAGKLYVAGTLDVAINQPAGAYKGSVAVTVEYQ